MWKRERKKGMGGRKRGKGGGKDRGKGMLVGYVM